MKQILICIILILISSCQESTQNVPDDKDVIILDNSNLEKSIYSSEDPWLLDLYAPWCGHCIKMTTEWSRLATKLKGSVNVAKIDASKYSQFNDLYGLKGFPHIVFIPGGPKNKELFYVHSGQRTVDAFEKWTLQKINQHKRSTLERLTDNNKWNEVCIGPHSDFCVVFILPKVGESNDEQRKFYLNIIDDIIKKFSRQPVSFLWAQEGDHQQIQQKLNINGQLPKVILINPTTKRYSIMPKSFTQDDFQFWLKNILDVKFQTFEGELIFGNETNENQAEKKDNDQKQL